MNMPVQITSVLTDKIQCSSCMTMKMLYLKSGKTTDVIHIDIGMKNTNKYEIRKVHAKPFKNLIVIIVSTFNI